MTKQDYLNLTDQELLERKKKLKVAKIMHALLIGLFTGIIIYGVATKGIGFFIVIPVIFIYLVLKESKKSKILVEVLNERGLG